MKHALLLAFVAFSCSMGAAETKPKRSLTEYELLQQENSKKREGSIALAQARASQNNPADWENKTGCKPRPRSFTYTPEDFTSSDSYDGEVPLWEL